jgi:hypothetical protein
MPEMRKFARYRVTVVAIFSSREEHGMTREMHGHTRDISVGGVFVATNFSVMSGARVLLEMTLPSLGAETTGSRLEVQGRVVRVERTENGSVTGFAVAGESMVLRNASPHRVRKERVTSLSVKM